VKAFYEDVWADLPDDPTPWAWAARRRLLLDEARPGERVLDLGCGAGRFLDALTRHGARPIGVDVSERALERAARVAPGADLRLLAPEGSLPLAHASVDLVWCSEVIEHVPDVGQLLGEARRVLAPGGRLLLTTPDHGRMKALAIALLRFDAHFDPLGQHVRFFTRRSLTAVLEGARLEDVRVRRTGGPPLLRTTLVGRAVRPSPHSSAASWRADSARRASTRSEAD
jgi:SAM-dependent methyltransferase